MAIAFLLEVMAAAQEPPTTTQWVMDASGQRVTVPHNPQRVLSLCTSATDTLVRLGLVDRLAGLDEYSRIVPGTTNIPVLGKGSAISKEQVLARNLDLAFVWWYQDDAAKLLAECGVPVVRIRSGRASEIPAMLRLVAQCFGREINVQTLIAPIEHLCAAAKTNGINDSPSVYLEMYGPFKTVGGDSYINDLLALAGARNIAAQKTGSVLLSVEHLLNSDPQVILLIQGITEANSFSRRPGLSSLSAVRGKRMVVIDRYLLVAGAGLPAAAAQLRQLISNSVSQ
jgi:iron complex transport system substrate-binding protein